MKQHLDLMKQVLLEGEKRTDRTGTGTLSIFGAQTRYDLREGFPLVTTREIDFEVVVKELFWFLRGETNIRTLGAKIWDAWAEPNGGLGPIYGAQWRRCPKSTDSEHVDQIAELVKGIQNDPYSRRHIVSAWNPGDLHLMKLAPCHAMFQVYVSRSGYMDLQLYQRSADLPVGVPFNIASYSLLLELLARSLGYRARYFIHTFGDAHIYLNQIDGVLEQIRREPRPLPKLDLWWYPECSGSGTPNKWFHPEYWTIGNVDVHVKDYSPHLKIKFPVAV